MEAYIFRSRDVTVKIIKIEEPGGTLYINQDGVFTWTQTTSAKTHHISRHEEPLKYYAEVRA